MRKKHYLVIPVIISLIIHVSVLLPKFKLIFEQNNTDPAPLKVRIVGEDKGLKDDLIYIQKKSIAKKSLQQKLTIPDLDLSPLSSRLEKIIRKRKSNTKVSKAIDNLKISNSNIKKYLKTRYQSQTPKELLSALDETDVLFDLQVPKGIKEDELNKHEMVFYSFRRRTALAYINSFYKELNSFERKNPHLRFPLTDTKQKIAGKITYDKNGDILKIETLKWTHITKLQSFFMDVLKNMSSLPNPPEAIVNKKDNFVINFTLTVNESRFR